MIRASLRFHGHNINKVFSGRQPRHANYKIQRFEEHLHLHHQGDVIHITLMMQKQEKQVTITYFKNSNYK